jgi:hypothetical protein
MCVRINDSLTILTTVGNQNDSLHVTILKSNWTKKKLKVATVECYIGCSISSTKMVYSNFIF